MNHLKDCPVIFADPDNDIEIKSVKKTNKKGGKYIFYNEIEMFFKTCDIVVIYQHFPRVKHEFFIKKMFDDIKLKINGEYYLYAIRTVQKDSIKKYFKTKEFLNSMNICDKNIEIKITFFDIAGNDIYFNIYSEVPYKRQIYDLNSWGIDIEISKLLRGLIDKFGIRIIEAKLNVWSKIKKIYKYFIKYKLSVKLSVKIHTKN